MKAEQARLDRSKRLERRVMKINGEEVENEEMLVSSTGRPIKKTKYHDYEGYEKDEDYDEDSEEASEPSEEEDDSAEEYVHGRYKKKGTRGRKS